MARRRGTQRNATTGTAVTVLVVLLSLAVVWQVASLLGPGDPAGPVVEDTFYTTADVNLRAGPGVDYEVLSVVPVRDEVTVTGDARDGFLPVRTQGVDAWIASDYLSPDGVTLASNVDVAMPTEAPLPTDVPPTQAPLPTEIPPTEVPVVTGEPVADTLAAETTTVGEGAPAARSLDVTTPEGERWAEVDRSTGTVTLHQGNTIVASFPALIGKDPSADGYYATAVGTYYVFSKERALTETPFAPGVYLTDWVGFDPERSNGFHSPTRDEHGNIVQTGGTATLGCVRLGEADARTMFDFAFIGMRVEVHD